MTYIMTYFAECKFKFIISWRRNTVVWLRSPGPISITFGTAHKLSQPSSNCRRKFKLLVVFSDELYLSKADTDTHGDISVTFHYVDLVWNNLLFGLYLSWTLKVQLKTLPITSSMKRVLTINVKSSSESCRSSCFESVTCKLNRELFKK